MEGVILGRLRCYLLEHGYVAEKVGLVRDSGRA